MITSRPRQPQQHRARHAVAAPALPPLAETVATVAALPALGDLPPWALPVAGAGLVTAVLVAVRLSTYSQLEYITASMLSRHVKAGGARVLQMGGSTRDLFYYPEGTVQVTVGGPDVTAVWEQAGMQAKVPVVAVKAEPQKFLSSQPGSSADSIVLLNQLHLWADPQQLISQAYRVLKPGGTLIFTQRLTAGPLQRLLGGGEGAVEPTLIDVVQMYDKWDFVQVDAALRDTNPHAVGVCVKPLAGGAGGAAQGSVDASAFEALMMSKMRRGKGSKEAGGQQAAGGQQQQQPGSGGGFQRKD